MEIRTDLAHLSKVTTYFKRDGRWQHASAPVLRLCTTRATELPDLLSELEYLVESRGLTAVGWIGYEAATAYGLACIEPPAGTPLVDMLLFDRFEALAPPVAPEPPQLQWRNTWERDRYLSAVARLRGHLAAGDSYQVNLCFAARAADAPPAEQHPAWFGRLVRAQGAHYPLFLQTPEYTLLSASPELYLARNDAQVWSRPMKGTRPRGRYPEQDISYRSALADSQKDRAENLMIVDMVRNDLGRVAQIGSVAVRDLFAIEGYPGVWQMVTQVQAHSSAPLAELIGATFPCASITGAPKARTMEIIRDLETAPRGVYTGAAGFIAPGRRMQLSVAIRTVTVHERVARFGVGSGVTWDSDPAGEWEECAVKTRVLHAYGPPAYLFETLFVQDGAVWLWEQHTTRLQSAARHFQFSLPSWSVVDRAIHEACDGHRRCKARLVLHADGTVAVDAEPIAQPPVEPAALERTAPWTVRLANESIDSACPDLYFKTDRRAVYEQARRGIQSDEVLLHNQLGHLTEGCITNVWLRDGDQLLTPPISDGLLGGTLRAYVLAGGATPHGLTPVERSIPISTISAASELYLSNALRGWRRARVVANDAT